VWMGRRGERGWKVRKGTYSKGGSPFCLFKGNTRRLVLVKSVVPLVYIGIYINSAEFGEESPAATVKKKIWRTGENENGFMFNLENRGMQNERRKGGWAKVKVKVKPKVKKESTCKGEVQI
jgi:hypothetical protein